LRVTAHAFRLHPGDDLKQGILAFAAAQPIRAGCVVTCVGSLRRAVLRFADRREGTELPGDRYEIVSLVGTVGKDGAHLHIALSDGDGRMVGGHLLNGCLIYTTAEIVLAVLPGVVFHRELDPVTGFHELEIETECDRSA
jgi:uncharacterized protein